MKPRNKFDVPGSMFEVLSAKFTANNVGGTYILQSCRVSLLCSFSCDTSVAENSEFLPLSRKGAKDFKVTQ